MYRIKAAYNIDVLHENQFIHQKHQCKSCAVYVAKTSKQSDTRVNTSIACMIHVCFASFLDKEQIKKACIDKFKQDLHHDNKSMCLKTSPEIFNLNTRPN